MVSANLHIVAFLTVSVDLRTVVFLTVSADLRTVAILAISAYLHTVVFLPVSAYLRNVAFLAISADLCTLGEHATGEPFNFTQLVYCLGVSSSQPWCHPATRNTMVRRSAETARNATVHR